MASIPKKQEPIPESEINLEERFRQLEARWLAEVGHMSSSKVLTSHPAFREIVALGEAVVPSMLRDLEERPRLWVWALPEITGANPVSEADRGHIARMSAAWLRWARENCTIWKGMLTARLCC